MAASFLSVLCALSPGLQGKTQLVKGKLQSLPEEMQALTINLSYYTEVGAFQKVGGGCREGRAKRAGCSVCATLQVSGGVLRRPFYASARHDCAGAGVAAGEEGGHFLRPARWVCNCFTVPLAEVSCCAVSRCTGPGMACQVTGAATLALYACAAGRQLLYVLDDLNAPRLDAYETAMPISLIRQHLGYGECFQWFSWPAENAS